MARFSLKWLFIVVAATAVLALPLSWLVRQRLAAREEMARVSAAIEAQTRASPYVAYGLNGSFSVNADFKGSPINVETARVFAENRMLARFVLLNCPVTKKEVTILNEADFLIMRGSDDEPPIGSLQGYRIANPSKPIRQTNF